MSEPYLIAHVVRGQEAFDIAEKIMIGNEEGWIISTSGHRARPYWYQQLDWVFRRFSPHVNELPPGKPPEGWPDHYPINQPTSTPASAQSGADLLEELGL